MTKEEIKDLLKFIIRKCDFIINNENYTADDYTQDKVEDIAEMCHRVLDGQFGEIIEPSLPSNLDEAAEEYSNNLDYYQYTGDDPAIAFKAGAEWMAGQGYSKEARVWVIGENETPAVFVADAMYLPKDLFQRGDKVIVQIRKKQ